MQNLTHINTLTSNDHSSIMNNKMRIHPSWEEISHLKQPLTDGSLH